MDRPLETRRGTMTDTARLIGFALAACLFVQTSRAAEDVAFSHENVMGTSLDLRVLAADANAAQWAEARVLGEIDRLSKIFSGYDRDSEFLRWQSSAGPVQISPELFEVLGQSDRWRALSGGAFDPRVEVLTQLWSRASAAGRLPTNDELAGARAVLSRPAWRLDPAARTAERHSGGPLSLNAIAKGWIVERACDAALARERGVLGLLLNVGGDLRVVGEVARTVAIAAPWAGSETLEPIARIEVRNQSVATSGCAQRGFSINGQWYSHIFDPRSGLPASGIAGASVIADRSADADALATVLNVLEPDESLRLVRSLSGVECLIVTTDGRTVRSDGWRRYERSAPALLLADAKAESEKGERGTAKKAAAPSWGRDFELLVSFEINRPPAEAGRYRRPYVAVWAENAQGFPVRNLVLWVSFGGAGPFQWLPDLKRWHRDDRARRLVDPAIDMVDAVAVPTRPPGKYSVLWDGNDDHGKPVPPGEYTIFIEAAREHGTYQSIATTVTLTDQPFARELKGNVEIKSAALQYRRRAPAK
jgi:thiamine biosynthesis lipoprotein